jgi:hypothetical protein
MAKRAAYDSVAIDVEGNALEGVEVTVYQSDGTTEATVYGSKGGSATTNPVTRTSSGLVQFWVDPGEYILEWHDPEIPSRFVDRTTVFESISGDDEGIDVDQLEHVQLDAVHFPDFPFQVDKTSAFEATTSSYSTMCSIASIPAGEYLVIAKIRANQIATGSWDVLGRVRVNSVVQVDDDLWLSGKDGTWTDGTSYIQFGFDTEYYGITLGSTSTIDLQIKGSTSAVFRPSVNASLVVIG